MTQYICRNINHTYAVEVNAIKEVGRTVDSRNGPTLEFPYPVQTTYKFPDERILFDKTRRVNPFFHLVEGLWIIAGSNSGKFIEEFNPRMLNYSDDGETLYGAYGYRLRKTQGLDQIEIAIAMLKADPDSRRVVLQMWDAGFDLGKEGKDFPCNTHIYLKIRDGALNMTVCCRSNDLLWGKLGANAVHFSMLQEYLAGRIGVELGVYTQFSDSLHVYTEEEIWNRVKDSTPLFVNDPYASDIVEERVEPYPMMKQPELFDQDLAVFMDNPFTGDVSAYKSDFFLDVVQPLAKTWELRHDREKALVLVEYISAEDLKLACRNWLLTKKQTV